MDQPITVHVSFLSMHYDKEYEPGVTVRDFTLKLIEDYMLTGGCSVSVNGVSMTHQLDYELQDGDNITVHPKIISGG